MKKLVVVAAGIFCLIAAMPLAFGCSGSKEDEPSTENPAEPEPEVTVYEPKYTIPDDETVEQYNTDGIASTDDIFKCASVEEQEEESPLKGKTIYWLGSSVTYGASSNGEAVADYIQALTGCTSVKNAVNSTTINGTGNNSYTDRLIATSSSGNWTAFDTTAHVDAFVCQISTNDAPSRYYNDESVHGAMTGPVIDETEMPVVSEYDPSTTLGGIEYIIAYAIRTWNCPVYFYSGTPYGSNTGYPGSRRAYGGETESNDGYKHYGDLVDEVLEIADAWTNAGFEVGVIDMYHDDDFNKLASGTYFDWAMSDGVHPHNAGYLQWWTPYFQAFLENHLQ